MAAMAMSYDFSLRDYDASRILSAMCQPRSQAFFMEVEIVREDDMHTEEETSPVPEEDKTPAVLVSAESGNTASRVVVVAVEESKPKKCYPLSAEKRAKRNALIQLNRARFNEAKREKKRLKREAMTEEEREEERQIIIEALRIKGRPEKTPEEMEAQRKRKAARTREEKEAFNEFQRKRRAKMTPKEKAVIKEANRKRMAERRAAINEARSLQYQRAHHL